MAQTPDRTRDEVVQLYADLREMTAAAIRIGVDGSEQRQAMDAAIGAMGRAAEALQRFVVLRGQKL